MEHRKGLVITLSNYCVYMHTCPNGKVYVGLTGIKPKYRWDNGHGYKEQVFRHAIAKYGWENITHTIIKDGLTLEEANELEAEMISKYKSNNSEFGYNIDNGGNGCGSKSLEHREKLRLSNSPTKQKLSKKVRCIETNEIFNSIREAARKTGANRNCISWCCNNTPRHKTTSGFHWEFI